jgi:glutathione S-transferase
VYLRLFLTTPYLVGNNPTRKREGIHIHFSVIADPSSDAEGKPTYVADSFKIAIYLDDKYPSPQYPVIMPPGTRAIQHMLFTTYYPPLSALVVALFYHLAPQHLDERTVEYWYRTRPEKAKPLPEDEAAKKWEELRQKFESLSKSLSFNDGTNETGPFIMGNRASFIDFAIGGFFYFIQRMKGKDSAQLKEMVEWQGGRWINYWKGIQEIENNSSQVA